MSRRVSDQGEGLCPGDLCLGGGLCQGVSIQESVSRTVSVQAGLCPGEKVTVQGGICQGDPHTVKGG